MKPILITLLLSVSIFAQASEDDRRANTPIDPFRIIGNIYYVGPAEVTSFLITTPKGHILIDSGYAETVPQIKANVVKLGFKLEDVKYLLNTQAHFDHAGGFAELKKLTNAKMIASSGDKTLLEDGGKRDFTWGDTLSYEPVKVDRIVAGGDKLSLGGVTLKAVMIPGHTKGSTAWTYELKDGDKTYNVIFFGSTTAPGYKFVGNTMYPNIVTDYESTFAAAKKLKVDIFLASHGSFFDLLGKAEKVKTNPSPNPFIDPKSYADYLAATEKDFREKLANQKQKQ
jgi:metallo-beta-lactamase class B